MRLSFRNLGETLKRPSVRNSVSAGTAIVLISALTVVSATIGTPAHAAETKKTVKTVKQKSVKEAESIEDYFGLGAGGDQQKRITRKINESIQKCMKSEGFEYKIPPDPAAQFPTGTDAASQQAFVKKWGYGISTTIDVNNLTSVDADPNAAILKKLSPADQKAYNKALVGNSATAGPTGDSKSCIAKAISILGDMTKLTLLFGKYETDVTKRIESNPKVVVAMKQWSGCMKEKGFSYAKDGDVPGDISSRLGKITGGAGAGGGGPFGGPALDPTKVDKPALAKLQKEEIATAVRDFECTEKHLKIRKTLKRDLDRDFITANQAAVDGFRDTLNG
jgi:hypothetical protein